MLKAKYEHNESCNLLTLKQAVGTFNVSASTVERLAKECDAKLKIGRAARYRKDVLQAHINTLKAV